MFEVAKHVGKEVKEFVLFDINFILLNIISDRNLYFNGLHAASNSTLASL